MGPLFIMRPLQLRGCAQCSGPASVSRQARPAVADARLIFSGPQGSGRTGLRVLAGRSQTPGFIWFSTQGPGLRALHVPAGRGGVRDCCPSRPRSPNYSRGSCAGRAGPGQRAGTRWGGGWMGGEIEGESGRGGGRCFRAPPPGVPAARLHMSRAGAGKRRCSGWA